MLKIDHLVYFPKGIENIDKTKKIMMIVWVAISFIIFHLTSFPNTYRAAWIIYIIGSLPVMVAFSDREYVQSKLVQEFPSLLHVLYKNNVIWMIIYVISQFCSIENKEEVYIRICVVFVFWFLSIITFVIYDKVVWSITSASITLLTGIFLSWLRCGFVASFENYSVSISVVLASVLISIYTSHKLITKWTAVKK